MSNERAREGCNLIEVRVQDLRLAARIGAHPHEMERRQTLRIAATLTLERAPRDRLDETVDYTFIVARAEALADRHIALIETFALELAEACIGQPGVVRAEVVVEKPGALANGLASTRLVLDRPEAVAKVRGPVLVGRA